MKQQVIDIDYKSESISQMLDSVKVILKGSTCHACIKRHENSIYNVMESSNITYEQLSLYDRCRNRVVSKSCIDLRRKFIKSKYYVVDTVFPLYRGLYCLRDSFSGSTCIKEVNQHELSLYKASIKLLYFLSGKIEKYSQNTVENLYTKFEYHVLLPELFASLVQGLITPTEEDMLRNLLNRDSEVATFMEKLDDISNMNAPIQISPILSDFSPIIIWSPTATSLLKEYLSMGLSVLLTQILKKLRTVSAKVNMRSISDFRLIFEIERSYTNCVFNIRFNEDTLGSTVFTLESENSVEIVPTYFNGGV